MLTRMNVLSHEDGSQPDEGFRIPLSVEAEPAVYRNVDGYQRLILHIITPLRLIEAVSSRGDQYYSEGEIEEAKRKKEELQVATRAIFDDPEIRDRFFQGFDQAMDLIAARERQSLTLRYGLDNPENTGRTIAQVSRMLTNGSTGEMGITGTRTGQVLAYAERKLRQQSRLQFYQEFLPKL